MSHPKMRDPMKVIARLQSQLTAVEKERDRAMQALEVLGIPKDYAKNPAKGIGILEGRYKKDIHFLTIEIAALRYREARIREIAEAANRNGFWLSGTTRILAELDKGER